MARPKKSENDKVKVGRPKMANPKDLVTVHDTDLRNQKQAVADIVNFQPEMITFLIGVVADEDQPANARMNAIKLLRQIKDDAMDLLQEEVALAMAQLAHQQEVEAEKVAVPVREVPTEEERKAALVKLFGTSDIDEIVNS